MIGAGKTAIDTCLWLLDAGVDPDRIRWVRGRDPWQFDRAFTQPLVFRGATVSRREIDALRTIECIVRARRVRCIGRESFTTEADQIPSHPGEVYVDCTAAGIPAAVPRPVFEPGRITIQYLNVGLIPWGAATIAFVEAAGLRNEEKNRLCPPVVFTDAADLTRLAYVAMQGQVARAPRASGALDCDHEVESGPGSP